MKRVATMTVYDGRSMTVINLTVHRWTGGSPPRKVLEYHRLVRYWAKQNERPADWVSEALLQLAGRL